MLITPHSLIMFRLLLSLENVLTARILSVNMSENNNKVMYNSKIQQQNCTLTIETIYGDENNCMHTPHNIAVR